MNNPAILTEHISKKYIIGHKVQSNLRESLGSLFKRKSRKNRSSEEFWALKDISFTVNPGEAVGIIGRNGAGKSTLLKVLSRITEPTKGRFEINGRVSSLLEVGTGFHPELSGRENIFLNGTILGMTRAEIRTKYNDIVDFSGVEQFIDTPVKRYSSGMFVRLAFGVAAFLEPEILIIDEVLAVGDAEFQKKCLGKMGEVAGKGRTVLFVSHNMSAIQQLCPRSILLQKGIIKAEGKTSNVIEDYLSTAGQSGQAQFERVGDQSVIIDDFSLTDINDVPVGEFFMGDTICLNLTIRFNETKNNVDLGIAVKNLFEEKITHFTNSDGGMIISGKEGDLLKIKIVIPEVYITAGIYKLDMGLEKYNDVYDCLFDCLRFSIIQGDKIKRGYVISSEIKTYIPTKWSVC